MNKNFISNVGLLLIFVFALTTIASSSVGSYEELNVNQNAISKYLLAQKNPDLSDEEKIQTAIEAYFTARYESQKLGELQNYSPLLDNDHAAWVMKENDKREIELLIASLFDLNYVEYTFTLEYDSIEIHDNEAIVQLRESHEVIFLALDPDPSFLYNLGHTFTLRQRMGAWVITSDVYQDELSQLMENENKDEILNRIHENYINEKQKTFGQGYNIEIDQSKYALNPDFNLQSSGKMLKINQAGVWHAYDRTSAVVYAHTWVSNSEELRNPAYHNYENLDCTNYVSQVIYAGAPQMDDTGTYQWYYYNVSNVSPSWINVSYLYNYLVNNTWTGPYGAVITNPCALRGGDVIQLYNGSTWFHSVVVTASLANCINIGPGQAIRYSAHDVDRYDYPLSYLSSYTTRFIQIQGWRD